MENRAWATDLPLGRRPRKPNCQVCRLRRSGEFARRRSRATTSCLRLGAPNRSRGAVAAGGEGWPDSLISMGPRARLRRACGRGFSFLSSSGMVGRPARPASSLKSAAPLRMRDARKRSFRGIAGHSSERSHRGIDRPQISNARSLLRSTTRFIGNRAFGVSMSAIPVYVMKGGNGKI